MRCRCPGAGRAVWGNVAADLEGLYLGALDAAAHDQRAGPTRVLADLHVRPGRELTDQIVAACAERGISIVCVAAPEGLGPARAVASAAPASLR